MKEPVPSRCWRTRRGWIWGKVLPPSSGRSSLFFSGVSLCHPLLFHALLVTLRPSLLGPRPSSLLTLSTSLPCPHLSSFIFHTLGTVPHRSVCQEARMISDVAIFKHHRSSGRCPPCHAPLAHQPCPRGRGVLVRLTLCCSFKRFSNILCLSAIRSDSWREGRSFVQAF